MKAYFLNPLVGVAPVRLGMTRDEVRHAMPETATPFRKSPSSEHETDAFHQSAFQVFYAAEPPTVEYIELSRCPHLRVRLHDVNIFETPANQLLTILGRLHDYDCEDPLSPCDVVFPDLQMSLWRPSAPDSPDDEDGRYFCSVGIGIHGYYN
jgi:hypothetical protein